MIATEPKSERISLEQIEATPEFQGCTVKQQVWLRTYFESGDPILATRLAYPNCKSEKHLYIRSHGVKQSPRVQTVLSLWAAKNPREVFLENLERRLLSPRHNKAAKKHKLTVAEISALRFLFEQRSWSVEGLPRINGYEPVATSKVPDGCRPILRKNDGVIVGYQTPEGEKVRF